jgi:hypothetical protein
MNLCMPHYLTSPTSSRGVPCRPPIFPWHPSLSRPSSPYCPSSSLSIHPSIPHHPLSSPQHPLSSPHHALSSLAPSLGHPQRSLILDKSLDLNQKNPYLKPYSRCLLGPKDLRLPTPPLPPPPPPQREDIGNLVTKCSSVNVMACAF